MNINNIQQWYQYLKNNEIHNRKLEKINRKYSLPTINSQEYNKVLHENAFKYKSSKEQQQIDNENDILLRKIIKVGERKIKFESTPKLPQIKVNKSKEIQYQNNFIAQKLINCSSSIKSIKLLDQYNNHLKMKKRLQKFQMTDNGIIKPKSLIAIEKLFNKRENNPQ